LNVNLVREIHGTGAIADLEGDRGSALKVDFPGESVTLEPGGDGRERRGSRLTNGNSSDIIRRSSTGYHQEGG